MAQEIINVGSTANDGTGDTARAGMTKVNNNFTEVYAAAAAALDRANHTGSQLASTISNFAEAVDDEVDSVLAVAGGLSKVYNDAGNVLTLSTTTRAVTTVVAASGSTETLDTATAEVFDVTMDANCTFTFSNPAASGTATAFTLVLRGAFTPTFPASVDWAGSAPSYTTPSVYVFLTMDGGTTWLGQQVGAGFA
jgi:hypothetical protein